MAPKTIKLGHKPIADHSFNEDKSLLAIARDNNAELYYDMGRGKFEHGATLEGHDKTVTAVDINANNEIVTCSQDRNAFVWKAQADGTWKPSLVLLRVNRAATSVRWSPKGDKFAAGTGARVIAVCYFDESNDWWISKHIKKPLKSTVLSIAWHPNNVLLASGSTDGHARVFSGYIKGIDERPEPSVWGERLPFQTLCGDFTDEAQAWVHDVAFSPSGNSLAWVTHDSSVLVAFSNGTNPHAIVQINTSLLPFRSLVWTKEDELIAAGFDCYPVVFQGDDEHWDLVKSIDDPLASKKSAATEQSAMHMFKELDLKGTQNASTRLPTVHQNAIQTVRLHGSNKISTSGDGQVVIFDI